MTGMYATKLWIQTFRIDHLSITLTATRQRACRATWQIDQDERKIGYYERGSRRVCDVVDCAVLKPELQEKLEQVRGTEWSRFPQGLKHLDVVAGENGVSFAPAFAEFETSELTLTIRDEVYSYNAEAFFQINPSLLGHPQMSSSA